MLHYRLWLLSCWAIGFFIFFDLALFVAGVWMDARFAGTAGILAIPIIAGLIAFGLWTDYSKPYQLRPSRVTKVSRKVRKQLREEHERRLVAESRAQTTQALELETGMRREERN